MDIVFIAVSIGAGVLIKVLLMLISDFGRVLDGSGIFFSFTSSLWVPRCGNHSVCLLVDWSHHSSWIEQFELAGDIIGARVLCG